jgi:hypothetical protein
VVLREDTRERFPGLARSLGWKFFVVANGIGSVRSVAAIPCNDDRLTHPIKAPHEAEDLPMM